MSYHWCAKPKELPQVLKYCGRCGRKTAFVCSGNFRVNAQKKALDVWLIYKCAACDTTWNMEIFSRVAPHALEKELYEGFLKNDSALAARYAYDKMLLQKNHAEADFDAIPFEVEGDTPKAGPQPAPITVALTCAFGARLDRLLAQKLTLSRTEVQRLTQAGEIRLVGDDAAKNLKGLRVHTSVTLMLSSEALKAMEQAEA